MISLLLIEVKKRIKAKLEDIKYWAALVMQCVFIVLLVFGTLAVMFMCVKTATNDVNAMRKADELKAAGWSSVSAHENDFTAAELLARKQFADKFDSKEFVFMSTNIYHQVLWKAEKK